MLNSNASSVCPHNTANFGPLKADIRWRVWGRPANFNGFRVSASLLQRRRSPDANQILHRVWPSPGLVYAIYIHFWEGGSCLPRDGILPGAKFVLRPSIAFSYIVSVLHGTPAADVSQTLRRGTRNGIKELSQWTPPIGLFRLSGHHVGHRPTF